MLDQETKAIWNKEINDYLKEEVKKARIKLKLQEDQEEELKKLLYPSPKPIEQEETYQEPIKEPEPLEVIEKVSEPNPIEENEVLKSDIESLKTINKPLDNKNLIFDYNGDQLKLKCLHCKEIQQIGASKITRKESKPNSYRNYVKGVCIKCGRIVSTIISHDLFKKLSEEVKRS